MCFPLAWSSICIHSFLIHYPAKNTERHSSLAVFGYNAENHAGAHFGLQPPEGAWFGAPRHGKTL
jgi:hypothetical protein